MEYATYAAARDRAIELGADVDMIQRVTYYDGRQVWLVKVVVDDRWVTA